MILCFLVIVFLSFSVILFSEDVNDFVFVNFLGFLGLIRIERWKFLFLMWLIIGVRRFVFVILVLVWLMVLVSEEIGM